MSDTSRPPERRCVPASAVAGALLAALLVGVAGGCGATSGGADPCDGLSGDCDTVEEPDNGACGPTQPCPGAQVCVNARCVEPIPCMEDDQCPRGLVCWRSVCDAPDAPCGGCLDTQSCVERRCVTRCAVDQDCPRPALCGGQGRCIGEPDPAGCPAGCPEGQLCLAGACAVPGCRADVDCDIQDRCARPGPDVGTCQTIRCTLNGDCRGGAVCDNETQSCRMPCDSDASCDPGRECVAGLCRPLPPECATDWDCTSRRICDAYRQCSRGPVCDPLAGDGACGTERRCDPTERRCVPDGCAEDRDCPAGQVCNTTVHDCETKVPTGGRCYESEQCLSDNLCVEYFCRKECDPLVVPAASGCPVGFVCAVVRTGDYLGRGICRPEDDGFPEGVLCVRDGECRADLFCIQQVCTGVCDPGDRENGRTCRDENKWECRKVESLGVGFCYPRPCNDDTNPCPPGRICLASGPRAGQCQECGSAADCPDQYSCDSHEFVCKPGCLITGCEEGYCDRFTNACEVICTPACGSGQMCRGGTCVDVACDPACDPRCACQRGVCVCPPDCREDGCENPLYVCDQATGNCNPPGCPACAPGQCCDETTLYQCGPCDLCGPTRPTGNCPYGQYCANGRCLDLPAGNPNDACGSLSNPPGRRCQPALTCCEPIGFEGAGGHCCQICNANGTCGTLP